MSSITSSGNSNNKFPINLPKTAETIGELYKADQVAEQKTVKDKSWLQKGHPIGDVGINVNFKLLGLLDGDAFIKSTPLEGYTSGGSMSYFHSFVEKLLTKAKADPEKIEVQTTGAWNGLLEIDSKNIYQTLPNYLDGKVDNAIDPFAHPEIFKKPQKSGTCAIKSVSTMFYYMMNGILGADKVKGGSDCFKKIRFLWQTQALVDYCNKTLRKAIRLPAVDAGLVRDIMENLSRGADKLYKNSLLTEKELEEMNATFTDIDALLKRVQEVSVTKAAAAPVACKLDAPPPNTLADVAVSPAIEGEEKQWNPEDAKNTAQTKVPKSDLEKAMDHLVGIKFQNFKDPSGILKQLKQANECIQKAYSEAYTGFDDYRNRLDVSNKESIRQELLDNFAKLIAHLPDASTSKNSVWNKIPQKVVVEYMEQIHSLMILLQNITLLGKKHDADTTAMHYALFAIVVQLAKRLDETRLKDKFTVNYFDLLYEIKSPQFIIRNPDMQKKLEAALAYFDPKFTLANVVEKNIEMVKEKAHVLFGFKKFVSWRESFDPTEVEVEEKQLDQDETVQYFKQFLDDKKILDQLHKRGAISGGMLGKRPLSAQNSIVEHLEALINDENRYSDRIPSFLPKSVNLLQDCALLCKFHHHSERYSDYSIPQLKQIKLEASIHGDTSKTIELKLSGPGYMDWDRSCQQKDIQDSHLRKEGGSKYVNELYERKKQNDYVVDQKIHFDMGIDSSRELEMIGIDPYGTVARAISFAERHMFLLKKSEFQDVLRVHLFGYGRLTSQLKEQPQIVSEMSKFFKDAMKHYQQSGDLNTCLYLARLGHDLKVFVQKAGYPDQLPDFRSILKNDLMAQFGKNSSDKQALFDTLVNFYRDLGLKDVIDNAKLFDQMAADLIGFNIIHTMDGGEYSNESKVVLAKFMPLIASRMEEGKCSRDKILNELVRLVNPQSKNNVKWTQLGQSSIYECLAYTVDIKEGRVRDKSKGESVSLPRSIIDSAHFKSAFSGKIESCKKLSIYQGTYYPYCVGSMYVVNEGLPNELVIRQKSYGTDFTIEKMINGIKYRYVEDKTSLDKLAPTVFGDKVCCWISQEKVLDRNLTEHLIAEVNGKQMFTAKLEKIHDKHEVKSIEKTNGHALQWVPFDTVRASLSVLSAIEKETQKIECWVKKGTQELAEVNCPRLGLSFVEKDGHLVSQQYPGYYLIENPEISLLSGAQFLTLQNREGETKVLFPNGKLDVKFSGNSLVRTLEHKVDLTRPLKWTEIELRDDALNTRSVEGRLLLVYLNVASGAYEKGFDILNSIVGLSRFKDDPSKNIYEKTAIGMLGELLEKDKHPAAHTMLMHLAVKYQENRLKYPLSVGQEDSDLFTLKLLGEAYETYSFNGVNAPHYRLTARQEKIFFDLFEGQIDKWLEKNSKKDDPFITRLIMKYMKNRALDTVIGERLPYLKEGVAKLGVRRAKPQINEPQKGEQISGAELRTEFQTYGLSHAVEGPETLFPCLIQDEKFFKDHFSALYLLARSGSEGNREALKRMLQLNSHLKSSYLDILVKVAARPGSYATFEEMQQAEKTINDLEAKKKAADEIERKERNAYWNTPWDSAERKQAQAKKDAAEKVCNNLAEKITKATKKRDDLYDNISYENGVIKTIKMIFNYAMEMLFGKFSVFTAIYETFYTLFKKRHHMPAEAAVKRTPLVCKGALKEADDAFNEYFAKILKNYFEPKKTKVDKYWDKDKAKYKLPNTHSNKNVQKKLREENKDLDAHRKTLDDTVTMYEVRAGSDINDLENDLKKTSNLLSTQLKTQRTALLWQVNHIPDKTKEKAAHITHERGQHKELKWEDIRKLTLDGSQEQFQARTHLGEKEAKRVLLGVSDYLIKTTRLDQIKAVMKAIEKAEQVKDEEKKKLLIQNVAAALKIVRGYTPDASNMNKQWFEVASHYHYRKIQLEKMEEVLKVDASTVLAEMPTGFGKTKTMVPSLNYDKALDGWVVINTWPGTLEMTNTLDVRDQMESSFGRMVDRFTFDRSSQITAASLKFLYEELMKDKKEGISINIRSETLRSLQLHFLLLLKKASDPKIKNGHREMLKEQIGTFIKILREIRQSGWTTIDEAHVTLDPMDKLIYTVGDPVLLPSSQIEIMQEIFTLLTNEPLASLVRIRDNQQYMLKDHADDSDFDKKIAPQLAEHFRKKFKIDKSLKKSYEDFVLGRKGEIPEWVKKHPKKGLIALVKGELTQVLKTSLKGSVDENYGLSKLHIKKKEYAISYASANTPKENETSPSQFKNPHETMNKTYITYLHKGLQPFQVVKMIELLKKQAEEQAKEGISLENTEANRFFKKLLPPTETRMLMGLSDRDVESLVPELSKNREAIFYYIQHIVTPELKIYPDILISTVHNFRSQFASSLSLSATPQSPPAHGPDTYFVPMVGTSGQVSHILLTKCKDPKSLHMVDAMKPEDVLDKTLDIVANNKRIHSMIDVGALYKGLSNKEVADKLKAKFKGSDIQAILFFDEKEGLFKVMDVVSGHVMDPAEMQVDPEHCQTFYDQSRCFGSDIKQAVDNIAVLLAGKGTTKATAGQGAGRNRQLDKGQSVEVVYQKELEQEIFGGKTKNIRNLLVYWIVNQVELEANKNYQSQLQQMDNEIQSRLYDKMLGLSLENPLDKVSVEPNVEAAINLFGKVQKEFYQTETSDPWDMYGPIPEDKDPQACLSESKSRCQKRVDSLNQVLSKSERNIISTQLNSYPDKWKTMALPDKVKALGSGMGMECEVLQEVEVETQVEVQAQVMEDLIKREPKTWNNGLDLFKDNWIKTTKQHTAINKITAGLSKLTHWMPKKTAWRNVAMIATGLAVGGLAAGAAAIAGLALPIIAGVGAAVAAVMLMLEFTPVVIRALTKSHMINRVSDVLSRHLPGRVAGAARFFNPNFLVTENFFVQKPTQVAEEEQRPFNIEQKPLFELVVIQDEEENGAKKVQMIAIDQNDSVYFHRRLREDRKLDDEAIKERKRKIAIYDIHNNLITAQGKNSFAEGELEKNKMFQELLADAKFLNGEINYTDAELKHIENRAKKAGLGIVGELYGKYILRNRAINRECVKKKPIYNRLALGTAAVAA